ncbi:MAG: hypothetical protein K2J48_04570 [Muribaculaceae bacterium]|nr:hypothetical protein [Muribaculaceae bacterium]
MITLMVSAQTKITLTVGDRSMTASLVENQATQELLSLLSKGDISINMADYGGFEKVGQLPTGLQTSNSQITTEPGDIMLYQGNQMVIFYGTNSWSYTRLGKIEGGTASNIKQFLGNGNITLTISLHSSSGVGGIKDEGSKDQTVYDVNGRIVNLRGRSVSDLPQGIYIVNGKKIKNR